MRIKLNKEGVFEVKHHILIHNRQLRKPSWQHLTGMKVEYFDKIMKIFISYKFDSNSYV